MRAMIIAEAARQADVGVETLLHLPEGSLACLRGHREPRLIGGI